jgi:hypothetical protein
MRSKRLVSPRANGCDCSVLKVEVISGRQIEQRFFDVLYLVDAERLYLPKTLRNRGVAIVCRVENLMEPALRFGIPSVLSEMQCQGERDVIEDLPVVDGIGSLRIIKVEVLDR